MIKKLLSIALVVVAVSANAQQLRVGGKQQAHTNLSAKGIASTYSVTIDTLYPASVASATGCGITGGLFNYVCDAVAPMDSGYIFGTGIIALGSGTLSCTATELGQKYNVAGAASVTEVLVFAGHAHGLTATSTAKIYSENATSHKPNTVIGSASTPVPLATYNTTGYQSYTFPTPVPLAGGNFFATVSSPATFGGTDQDTLSILSTELGVCPAAGADSCSALKLSAPVNSWYLTKVGFGANGDLMIFPVISMTTSNATVTRNGLSIYAASPNPTNNTLNINFSLANATKVDIDIVDVTGKIVKSIKGTETFSASDKHTVAVDVTSLESGSYFYSINANGTKMFSKFVVTK